MIRDVKNVSMSEMRHRKLRRERGQGLDLRAN